MQHAVEIAGNHNGILIAEKNDLAQQNEEWREQVRRLIATAEKDGKEIVELEAERDALAQTVEELRQALIEIADRGSCANCGEGRPNCSHKVAREALSPTPHNIEGSQD